MKFPEKSPEDSGPSPALVLPSLEVRCRGLRTSSHSGGRTHGHGHGHGHTAVDSSGKGPALIPGERGPHQLQAAVGKSHSKSRLRPRPPPPPRPRRPPVATPWCLVSDPAALLRLRRRPPALGPRILQTPPCRPHPGGHFNQGRGFPALGTPGSLRAGVTPPWWPSAPLRLLPPLGVGEGLSSPLL